MGRDRIEGEMRRLLSVLGAVGLLVALLPGSTLAAPAPQDMASGNGVRAASGPGNPTIGFSFNARSGSSGESPSGTFTMTVEGGLNFTGDVSCLRVTGSSAVIAGTITSGAGASPDTDPGQPFVAIVEDHGPTKGGVSPDMMSYVVFGIGIGTAGELCDDPDFATGPDRFALVSGKISVKDR